MGEHHEAAIPTAVYGGVLLASAIAWELMQTVIIRSQGEHSPLARALGRDVKGKLSPLCYLAGTALSFVDTRIADAIYALVALMGLIPDRRIERAVSRSGDD
jgi:uncharacterized membrane protein